MEKQAKTARLEVRADPTWLKKLDDWRRKQDDVPTRAEALRRISEQVFQQAG